jgi:hypothetical protein
MSPVQQRTLIEVVAALSGLLLAVRNLAATRRIWTTRELERPQQIAQTILVWLLPGMFLAVRLLTAVYLRRDAFDRLALRRFRLALPPGLHAAARGRGYW